MKPKVLGLYRVLYGSDFVGESLASIYDHCDTIVCFVSREVFGGGRKVRYFGHDVYIPHDIDGMAETLLAWKRQHDHANKVRVIANPYPAEHVNVVGRLINEHILPNYDCSHILFVEPDEVWHERTIVQFMELLETTDHDEYMAGSWALFWRSYKYAAIREGVYTLARRIRDRQPIGPVGLNLTDRSGKLSRLTDRRICVHNFGYASSERTLFWKHLTCLSFSRDLKMDSPPREDWFEKSWRAWNWHTNRRTDLCPSIGYEDAFGEASEYPFAALPSIMQERIRTRSLSEWIAMDAAGAAVA